MKKTFFNSLLKRLSLLTLATGTLCATTVALSSCGSGGGGATMNGIRMELYAGSAPLYITVQEPVSKGSPNYRGYTAWGEESNTVACMVRFDKMEKDSSGEIASIDFSLSLVPGYTVFETEGFKAWWGVSSAYDGVTMVGTPQFKVTCTSGNGVREGTFTVVDDESFDIRYDSGGVSVSVRGTTENPTGWTPPQNGTAVISHN